MQATTPDILRARAGQLRADALRVRADAAYADGQAYRDDIAHAERLEAQARQLDREADEALPR
jgi:hypothetical protein